MTDDRTLSCFLIGDHTPFYVTISVSKYIEDLKMAIKKEKKRDLKGVAAHTLQVWKVNGSLPQEPDLASAAKTELEKLGSSLSNFEYIWKHFTGLLDNNVHVIVKRPEVDNSAAFVASIMEFQMAKWIKLYELAWGKDMADILTTDGKTSAKFINLAPIFDGFRPPRILVRETYEEIYDLLEKEAEKKQGIVITGSLGIGKSLSLLYFLIRRLSDRGRTAYQFSPGHYFLFEESGVYRVNDGYGPPSTKPDLIWALTYSNSSLSKPSGAFSPPCMSHFLVQASSPVEDNYGWTKEVDAGFIVMDLWSWQEMTQLISIQGLDAQLVSEIYSTWGPSAQQCFRLKSVEDYRPFIRHELADCRGRMGRIIRYMTISGGAAPSSLSAPHSVFYIRPVKPLVVGEGYITGTEIYIPTDALRQECFRSLISEETTSQQEFFDALSTDPLSRSTGNNILTKWMHFQLSGHMQAQNPSVIPP